MIKAENLSKSYRKKQAVSDLSFEVQLGKVTGFVGPNGSGKSTTMRLMTGLDNGGGITTFDGKRLHEHDQPASVVGVLLEAKAFHPTRTAYNHLAVLATQGGLPLSRVNEVLGLVGLSDVAKSRPGKFSLGMSQRLGIAAAILGNPKYLLLDEPANGLDPEGIAWLRKFIRHYADAGNAVFISSHLLGEMSQFADNVIVIGKGKLISSTTIKELTTGGSQNGAFVRTNDNKKLIKLADKEGIETKEEGSGVILLKKTSDEVGKLAFANKLTVLELRNHEVTLEDAFLELTSASQEYKASQGKKS